VARDVVEAQGGVAAPSPTGGNGEVMLG